MTSDKDKPDLPPMAERRINPRRRVVFGGVIVHDEGRFVFNCRIRDLSDTGARIEVVRTQSLPDTFYLINTRTQTAHLARLIWRRNDEAALTLEKSFDLRHLPDPSLAYLAKIASSRNTATPNWR